jgi:hypothetical protein
VSSSLLDDVLEAHGGIERWRSARTVRARVRSGGLLPRTRVPGNRFADYRLSVGIHDRRVVIDPFPDEARRGVFDDGEVRIESLDGVTIESRSDPRPLFSGRSGLRRNLRWDALDSVYFGGYAMWNYLTTPHLLTLERVEVREGEHWDAGDEKWRTLEVNLPASIVTHSREQRFYFDRRGYLRRHDYVAEVVGGWAHAAHLCDEHVEAGGLVFPTRRRVRPVGPGNRPLPLPTLVSLDLSEIEVDNG